jgi:hypothetical protein
MLASLLLAEGPSESDADIGDKVIEERTVAGSELCAGMRTFQMSYLLCGSVVNSRLRSSGLPDRARGQRLSKWKHVKPGRSVSYRGSRSRSDRVEKALGSIATAVAIATGALSG